MARSRGTVEDQDLAFALNELGQVARFTGRYDVCRSLHEEALAIHKSLGDELWTAFSIDNLAYLTMDLGRFADALELHAQAQRIWPVIGPRIVGWTRFLQGHLESARRASEDALEQYHERRDGGGVIWALADLGYIATKAGELSAAAGHFEECLLLADQRGQRNGIARSLTGIAQLATLQSHHDLAHRLTVSATRLLADFGLTVPVSETDLIQQAAVKGVEPEPGPRDLRDAIRAALEFVRTCRSDAVRGAGRPAGRQAGLLTRRELEVLHLVASGKTNRQIASELVLSPRTVSRHVESIFAKLQVNSRAAAAGYAVRRGLS